jgi:peptide/nickel transport system ATP-binding protein
MSGTTPLLTVTGLTTEFVTSGGWHAAIGNVSFVVHADETLALVGESGCGKSVMALSIMRLLPASGARIAAGEIRLGELDLARLSEARMRDLRGDRLGMVFQEPMTPLNPVLPIGLQVAEPLLFHKNMSWSAARAEAVRLLDRVGIPGAAKRVDDYPHEFSGGMRQRVVIAMALACAPELLLADEPTTALDVTIQAQVLGLLDELKRERRMGMILITHSLGVVADVADRVAVMYAGEIVETALTAELFARPTHPYTEALLAAIPRADRDVGSLRPIPGSVPAIDRMPKGCRFAARCPLREPRCEAASPPLAPIDGGGTHQLRCWVRAELASRVPA